MSPTDARPVAWIWRKHWPLLTATLSLMALSPYLGALPIRTIPAVVALAGESPSVPVSGDLALLLGDAAHSLSSLLGLLVACGLFAFALSLINTRLGALLSTRAATALRLRLHQNLLSGDSRESGDLIKTALLDQARVVASYAVNTLPAGLGVVFGVLVWGNALREALGQGAQDSTAFFVVLCVIIVLVAANLIAVWLSGRKSQASQHAVMMQQAAVIRLVNESVENLQSLRIHTAEAAQHARLRACLERQNRAEVRVATWSSFANALSAAIVVLGTPILVIAWLSWQLPAEQLAVMIPSLMMLQRAISSVGSLWTMHKLAKPALDLVSGQLAGQAHEAPAAALEGGTERPCVPPERTDSGVPVSFCAVRFALEGKTIVEDVSFDVRAGETVALVGRGGSGKSSLLRLLLRIAKPTSGTITLDGEDIAEMAPDVLRRRVGLLEQHPAIFARSVRENLLLDDEEVQSEVLQRVLGVARLREVVDGLDDGLDAPLQGLRTTLSGSERRRLGLARVLLRKPAVILIDELEAGLPQADAQAIYRDVCAATSGRTRLVVTHRPDLLPADRIHFLHQGRIAESGSHDELQAACEPYRALLAEVQKENCI